MKKPSRSTLVKKADKAFSEYIRQRYADRNGNVECFTCGKVDHWKSMDAGHFVSRKQYSTRWDEQNVQVQCKSCNIFRYGEQYKFGVQLDAKYGRGTADLLWQRGREILKLSNYDLEWIVKEYKEKLDMLEK